MLEVDFSDFDDLDFDSGFDDLDFDDPDFDVPDFEEADFEEANFEDVDFEDADSADSVSEDAGDDVFDFNDSEFDGRLFFAFFKVVCSEFDSLFESLSKSLASAFNGKNDATINNDNAAIEVRAESP